LQLQDDGVSVEVRGTPRQLAAMTAALLSSLGERGLLPLVYAMLESDLVGRPVATVNLTATDAEIAEQFGEDTAGKGKDGE
jgi:hypothetical protein